MEKWNWMKYWTRPGNLASILAFLASVLVVLIYFQSFVWGELRKLFQWPPDLTFNLVIHLLILALLVVLLRLIFIGLKRIGGVLEPEGAVPEAVSGPGESFPSPATKLVGVWLLVLSMLSVLGLFLCFFPPQWPGWILDRFPATGTGGTAVGQINEALITLFGAGIGSTITTILAFLRHAANSKDFDRAHVPWYVARPVMGMLLGLIFYFLIRGGLWATMGDSVSTAELNAWSLAGIGALVGLFSRSAIEKLRELFHTLFRTAPEGGPEQDLAAHVEDLCKVLGIKLSDEQKAAVEKMSLSGLEELREHLVAKKELPKSLKEE